MRKLFAAMIAAALILTAIQMSGLDGGRLEELREKERQKMQEEYFREIVRNSR
jgi:hypothetical protein